MASYSAAIGLPRHHRAAGGRGVDRASAVHFEHDTGAFLPIFA